MNHKRGRPKNRRAGCLFCKAHKANGAKNRSLPRDVRRLDPTRTTDNDGYDEDMFAACDCLECRLSELFDSLDYVPPPVTFTLQEVAR